METSGARERDGEDLDIHAPEFARDPYPAYERLRRECPVAHGSSYGGYWLLTRYEDVRDAARDWRTYTSSVPGVTSIPAATRRTKPQLPLEVDPPLHTRYRALVNPVFAPARIDALRPRVEALAAGLVDTLLTRLEQGPDVDLVAEYAVPFTVGTLAEFTGLPREDGERWVAWQQRLFDMRGGEDGARATQEINAYIAALIERRKRQPLDGTARDFIGLLLESEVDGHKLADEEVLAFCQLQFAAGFETTADAISIALHYLATHPETRAQLARAPDLLPYAVEEFLRYATPIQIFGRNATRDLDLHGRHVPKGDVVALSYGSANHDPSAFRDPQTCILDRFQGNGTPRHLTFGAGVHLCLGAPVARLELAITLRAFTTRVPPLVLTDEKAVQWKTRGDRRGIARLPVHCASSG